MGQDQRQIIAAEELDNNFLIEFLPYQGGIHLYVFIAYDVTSMATPFVCLGFCMLNEMWAACDEYFGLVNDDQL